MFGGLFFVFAHYVFKATSKRSVKRPSESEQTHCPAVEPSYPPVLPPPPPISSDPWSVEKAELRQLRCRNNRDLLALCNERFVGLSNEEECQLQRRREQCVRDTQAYERKLSEFTKRSSEPCDFLACNESPSKYSY